MTNTEAFSAVIRRWKPGATSGLAVIDLPADRAEALGGLKQLRVRGALNGHEFASNTMPAGGGVLAMSVSKQMMKTAGVEVGDTVEVQVELDERPKLG
jgi:Domain of unknown function (DUF1905)